MILKSVNETAKTIKELRSLAFGKYSYYDGYKKALKKVLELIDECKFLTKMQKFMLKARISRRKMTEESLSDKITEHSGDNFKEEYLMKEDVKEAVKKIIDRISGNESYALRFILKKEAIRIIMNEMGEKLTK